jgi:hypothetical protein
MIFYSDYSTYAEQCEQTLVQSYSTSANAQDFVPAGALASLFVRLYQ